MKLFRLILTACLLLLSAPPLQSGGALIFDGANDWLDCAPVAFDLTRDSAASIAWVRPNFTPARNTDSIIWSTWNGGFLGANLRWHGTLQRFTFTLNDPDAAFDGTSIICAAAAFNAGDFLGISVYVIDNLQMCEIHNITQAPLGGSTSVSFFGGFVLNTNSPSNLEIGSWTGGLANWDGEIHMITISNKRIINLTLSYLESRRKLLYYPMQPADRFLSPPPPEGYVDYLAAYTFYPGDFGAAFNQVLPDVSRAFGTGNDCTVGGGSPTVTGSWMPY